MEKITFAPPLHEHHRRSRSISSRSWDGDARKSEVCEAVQRRVGGVESALKFVRQYFKQTGRSTKYKFISRYYSYHGGTFGGMAASGNRPAQIEVRAADGRLPEGISADLLS